MKPNKRIFDNAKVSDHFAIMPTLQAPHSLNEIEAKLYDMVVKRFLAVFYPPAEFMVTTRISTVPNAGAGAPVPDQRQGAGQAGLAGGLRQGGAGGRRQPGGGAAGRAWCAPRDVDVNALKTKPPARYTEATLLGAMEGAGKLIDDDELREAMQEKGLGTPATRSAIIEGLIYEKYMHRDGPRAGPHRQGLPADDAAARAGGRGADQARADRQLGVPARADGARQAQPRDLHGRDRRDDPAHRRKAKEYDRDTIPGDYATLATPCPNCGGVVKENYRRFTCTGTTARQKAAASRSARSRAAAAFETDEVEAFLATGRSARWRVSAPRPAGRSRPS